MFKPTLQFRKLSEVQVGQYAESILVKMTENANLFPDPDPALEVLEETLTAFRRAVADAAFRDMRQVVIKNQRFTELKSVLFDLSLYVTKVAQGNRALILAAGFVPTKAATPLGLAPKPTDLRATALAARPGVVELRVSVWNAALMYFFEYRKVQSEDAWERVSSSRANIAISGLESLERYEFRVAYATTNPTLTYSDVIRSVIM